MIKHLQENALLFWTMLIIATIVILVLAAIGFKWNREYEHGKRSLDKHISKAKIIAVNGIEQTVPKGAITRSIVGGMLAGPTGALVGAMSASSRTETIENEYTFLVTYDFGTHETEKVKESSPRFKFLLSKLEDD